MNNGQLKTFLRNEGGNISMMAAFVALLLVFGLAVAIDIPEAAHKKKRLNNVSDAISLMIAKSELTSQQDMHRVARAYLDEAYPGLSGNRLEILKIERNGDDVTVELSGMSDGSFSPALGKNAMPISVSSTATVSRQSIDIALVLDSTGSMSGSKMATLKSAAHDMVDAINDYNRSNVRMSVVPFSNYVNVGTAHRGESWLNVLPDVTGRTWRGCVGSRLVPFNDRPAHQGRPIPALSDDVVSCGTELQPLTSDFGTVKSTISGLVASGWTYMPSGLIWGWRTLDDGAPFAHSTPKGTQKVLVLMTDGENTRAKNGILHNQAGMNHQADATTRHLCTGIKDDDIVIYTIAYEVSSATTRGLLQGCASDSSHYFDAKNASDLNAAFKAIAESLNQLRISA